MRTMTVIVITVSVTTSGHRMAAEMAAKRSVMIIVLTPAVI